MTPDDAIALSFLCARVLKKEAEVASSRVISLANHQKLDPRVKFGEAPPASALGFRVGPQRCRHARVTNEFVIRDSAKISNIDKHLAAPSNEFLMAAGASINPRTTPEIR